MADRIYSDQEAQEILSLAAKRATSEGAMTRERLVQAAAEMGIEPEMVLAAEREVLQKQARRALRSQFIAERRQESLSGASQFVGTAILLFGINFFTSGGFHGSIWSWWAIWPCGFMLLNVLRHSFEAMTAGTALANEEFEAWSEKQQKKQKVSEWIEGHPDATTSVKVARMACAEFDAEHKDHAVDKVHRETGLRRKDAKDLVNAIYREQAYGTPVETNPKWATLEKARPSTSSYEAARKALEEVGPNVQVATELVRARTGLSPREAEEAVQAALELSH